eukprot:m51a1_g7837 hypothetical protein (380) ;mRNA; f:183782-185078
MRTAVPIVAAALLLLLVFDSARGDACVPTVCGSVGSVCGDATQCHPLEAFCDNSSWHCVALLPAHAACRTDEQCDGHWMPSGGCRGGACSPADLTLGHNCSGSTSPDCLELGVCGDGGACTEPEYIAVGDRCGPVPLDSDLSVLVDDGAECVPGSGCVEGRCTRLPPDTNGTACGSDGECGAAGHCSANGTCISRYVQGVGAPCENDRDCAAGICETPRPEGPGRCGPLSPEVTTPCATAADCPSEGDEVYSCECAEGGAGMLCVRKRAVRDTRYEQCLGANTYAHCEALLIQQLKDEAVLALAPACASRPVPAGSASESQSPASVVSVVVDGPSSGAQPVRSSSHAKTEPSSHGNLAGVLSVPVVGVFAAMALRVLTL